MPQMGDYGAMVMAAFQVFLINNIISTEDHKELYEIPTALHSKEKTTAQK